MPGKFLSYLGLMCLILASIGCVLFALYVVSETPGMYLDFHTFYAAGMVMHRRGPRALYDAGLQQQVDRAIAPNGPFLRYAHTPPEALLFLPLARFSFPAAFLLWSLFNILVLALSLLGFRYIDDPLKPNDRLLWLILIIPFIAAPLALGQDGLLPLPVFLSAYLALKREREMLAGSLLGVGLFRFEILLPFILVFAMRKRWKLLAGFAATGAAGLLLSLALVGFHGMIAYAHLLISLANLKGTTVEVIVQMMPSLRGVLASLLGGYIPSLFISLLVGLGSVGVLCWAAWEFRSVGRPADRAFDLQFSMAVVAALLASYHLWNDALSPLILVAYLIMVYERRSAGGRLFSEQGGTILMLLFPIVFVIGPVFGFRGFCVLAIVMLGICGWLPREIRALRPGTLPREAAWQLRQV